MTEGKSKLPLQYEDGPDYCTVKDAQGRDFALTMQPDLMRSMEKALAAVVTTVAQPWQLPKSLPLEGFASQPAVRYHENVLDQLQARPSAVTVGMDWKLSDETKQQIDEIDRNIREAPANIASLDAIARLRAVPQAAPDRQKVIDLIGYHFAALVSGNNQPHMSGDPRARLLPHVRRRFDDACETAAEAILALPRPK
jgi:hypothetical protein